MFSRFTVAGLIASSLIFVFAGCNGGGVSSSTSIPQSTILQSSVPGGLHTVQGLGRSIAKGATLFYDDFGDRPIGVWTLGNGSTWTICKPPGFNSEFCTPGNPKGDALATAGSVAWMNYEVDAWVVPGATGAGGVGGVELLGRYVDGSHFYQLELRDNHGHQNWAMDKLAANVWTRLATGPASYLPGQYFHLRLAFNGATLTAYATTKPNDWNLTSEKQLGTVTDSTYVAGSIGVRAIGGIAARYDDVGVYALGDPSPVPSQAPPANPALIVPSGFYVEVIANVPGARQLAIASNGDLLVGTESHSIAVVPYAESDGVANTAQTLATLPEAAAQGIALGPSALFAGTETGVWKIPYTPGMVSAPPATKIAAIRTGPIAPHSDGDVHRSTSLIVGGATLYVGVGSSCNACIEVDPTRGSVQAMNLDGSGMHTYATRIRNAMAFTVNPASGMVFTGGAGQDNLPWGHPYEYLDALTSHAAVADYGWPACEEDHIAYIAGANCANAVQPIIEFPAYSTLIGAAYYPAKMSGTYVFPPAFRGGIFASMHGSWHAIGGVRVDAPHVAFVAMNGDVPAKAVNWSNPAAQWSEFFSGFQDATGGRIGITTGVAVGPRGSLFVADQTGPIYRIRPGVRP